MPSEGLYSPPQNPSDQIWPMVKALGQGMVPEYLKPNEGPIQPPNAEGKMPSVEPMNALPWLGVDMLGNAPAGGAKAGAALMKGIMAGPAALTADRRMLAKATDMAQSFKNPRDILAETGWYRGADGKWRFEINDAGFNVMPPKSARYMTIGNIEKKMPHPELYEAYPSLKSYSTLIGKSRKPYGEHASPKMIEGGSITLVGDENYYPKGGIHELQHAVQHIEDFVPGANSGFTAMKERFRMANLAGVPVKELPKDLSKVADATGYRNYFRHAGEVEARNATTRLPLDSLQRRLIPPLTTVDTPVSDQLYPKEWFKTQSPEIRDYIRALTNKKGVY